MVRKILLVLLAIFMIAGGINHFLSPAFYLRMMPDYIPAHELMVQLSGIAEIVLGVALLYPKTRILAAWGIILLLLAVFPANLHMYLHNEQWPEIPPIVTLLRLPFQLIFMAWAWVFTRKTRRR